MPILDGSAACITIKKLEYRLEPVIYLSDLPSSKLGNTPGMDAMTDMLETGGSYSGFSSAERLYSYKGHSASAFNRVAIVTFTPIIMPDSAVKYLGMYINFRYGGCK